MRIVGWGLLRLVNSHVLLIMPYVSGVFWGKLIMCVVSCASLRVVVLCFGLCVCLRRLWEVRVVGRIGFKFQLEGYDELGIVVHCQLVYALYKVTSLIRFSYQEARVRIFCCVWIFKVRKKVFSATWVIREIFWYMGIGLCLLFFPYISLVQLVWLHKACLTEWAVRDAG